MSMVTICWIRAGRALMTDDAVGEWDSLIDVVGDEDDRLFLRLPDLQELAPHGEACDGVKRAERLVEKEHVGIDGEGARDLQPLLHAARELGRVGALEAFETEPS